MSFLELKNVVKRYGAATVVHGVSLAAEKGEFVVFVGPSGCGKSTLLRMIAGLEEISDGDVWIDGRMVTGVAPADREVSMVFQSYALYPHMSVFENIAFGLRMAKMPSAKIKERVDEAARILQIGPLLERKPRQLSGGQRQRVAIGRAIVRHPKLFLFDEPLSNLDAELRTQMRVEIAKLHRELGVTMVYVTHDQVEAMTLADRIVVLRGGLIEQVGSPSELYDEPANRFVAGFIGSPKMNFIGATVASVSEGSIRVQHPAFVGGALDIARRANRPLAVGAPVAVGLRPENLALGGGPPLLRAAADFSENLGGHTQIYATIPEAPTLAVVAPGRPQLGARRAAGPRPRLRPPLFVRRRRRRDLRERMTTHLGIDVGTSSVKAVLIDEAQRLIAEGGAPLAIDRPRPLWSEQDPEAWWLATQTAIAAIRAAAPEAWGRLASIGLSGQQHGATLLDAEGRALRPCILWNDGRSGQECRDLIAATPDFTKLSSNTTMPGFTAPKLLWVARHEPDVFAKTAMILLPKDYVRFRLSGDYVSEMSDRRGHVVAQRRRTALGRDAARRLRPRRTADAQARRGLGGFDLAQRRSRRRLGPARPSHPDCRRRRRQCLVRRRHRRDESRRRLPVARHLGRDLFGDRSSGRAAGAHLARRFCHALPGRWHGMVVALSGAAALSWIAGIAGQAQDVRGLLARAQAFADDPVRRAHAPVFLPYLTGERTPHNDPNATAAFAGLTADHDAAALAYAVIEGVAFALQDCLDVLQEAGAAPTSCMFVGGGARSAYWGQLLADVTGLTLDLPEGAELGAAFGAARLGMIAGAEAAEAEVCVKPRVRASFSPVSGPRDLLRERGARARALYRPG